MIDMAGEQAEVDAVVLGEVRAWLELPEGAPVLSQLIAVLRERDELREQLERGRALVSGVIRGGPIASNPELHRWVGR